MGGQVQGIGTGDIRDTDSPGVFFRHGRSFWEEQVAVLLAGFRLGGKRLGYESCLVYDHLLDHTSSVIYRHCSSHTLREQGMESKNRGMSGRACIVYCLMFSPHTGFLDCLLASLGSRSALFIWNRNTSTHLHHTRIAP